jgi:hypothetical protein
MPLCVNERCCVRSDAMRMSRTHRIRSVAFFRA